MSYLRYEELLIMKKVLNSTYIKVIDNEEAIIVEANNKYYKVINRSPLKWIQINKEEI